MKFVKYKKIIYKFSSKNILMVEMKNSFVWDISSIFSALARVGIWFLHTTDTLKGQIELNLIPWEKAHLPGAG